MSVVLNTDGALEFTFSLCSVGEFFLMFVFCTICFPFTKNNLKSPSFLAASVRVAGKNFNIMRHDQMQFFLFPPYPLRNSSQEHLTVIFLLLLTLSQYFGHKIVYDIFSN